MSQVHPGARSCEYGTMTYLVDEPDIPIDFDAEMGEFQL